MAGIGWLSTRGDLAGPTAAKAASSIAVLPFTDMSPGGGQEYFGDGMTEELINALTKLEGIGVVSRTSAFAYKGQKLDVREIGRRLEVGNVLEGSIRVADDRLRVTARLVDVENGIDLWSESYDREMKDVFSIQEEIARSIVAELEPELASAGVVLVTTGTHDAEAYQLYAIALIHAGLGDRGRALTWLERAYTHRSPGMHDIKVDPRLDDLRSDPRFVSLVRRMDL
jgi:TolB-like protein